MFDNQMPNVSGNTGGAWGQDFSGQLNNMLAPYQQMAQRMNPQVAQQLQNPYATMKPNGWLQQNHPQIAGVLDNAFLTMGMTPAAQGPEGAGGGIARTMQGLIGAQQYNRQRMMQSAMLPYQMAQQGLGALDTISQIGERQAMVPFRQAQERRYDAQSDMYYNRMAQGDRSKALTGPPQVDDKGQSWDRTFDPISGTTRLYSPTLQKHADELPADQQPAFTKEERNQRMSTPGGLLGEVYSMMDSPDPAVRTQGALLHQRYINDQAQIAGGRAGAVQTVTQPQKDTDTFVKNERATALAGLSPTMNARDWQQANITNPNTYKDGAYDKYVKTQSALKQQTMTDLDKYEKSSAPRQGINFQAYMQNREQYDGSAPNPAPPTTPSANEKPVVNKNWSYGQ
jgi:hypothetical protein